MALFDGSGDPSPSHTILHALVAVDDTMQHGDAKYGENEWAKHPPTKDEVRKHLAAVVRHLGRYLGGEETDESGHPALAHVAARALMALEYDRKLNTCSLCGGGPHGLQIAPGIPLHDFWP